VPGSSAIPSFAGACSGIGTGTIGSSNSMEGMLSFIIIPSGIIVLYNFRG
jgi:hypothetical protein